jgi:hypothetical protein
MCYWGVSHSAVTGSLWRRQSRQSFNTWTPFNFFFYSLHVLAPTGHPQVRYTISYYFCFWRTILIQRIRCSTQFDYRDVICRHRFFNLWAYHDAKWRHSVPAGQQTGEPAHGSSQYQVKITILMALLAGSFLSHKLSGHLLGKWTFYQLPLELQVAGTIILTPPPPMFNWMFRNICYCRNVLSVTILSYTFTFYFPENYYIIEHGHLGPSCHLKMETDPVSETLWFLAI